MQCAEDNAWYLAVLIEARSLRARLGPVERRPNKQKAEDAIYRAAAAKLEYDKYKAELTDREDPDHE